jgi:ATP-binding protein involved in chromosome partitioning
MIDAALAELLPAHLASRLRTASLREGRVIAVFDAGGLSGEERGELEAAARAALLRGEGVSSVHVAMSAERQRRRTIAIGSGKGGVGKSTLTANLAVALARRGLRVGVVDADIYGPSQPTLLGVKQAKPEADGEQLVPINTPFGVRMLSIGQMVAPGKALAWRGPMIGKALAQLLDAAWDEEELLLVDLPPGTGDVQLTMLQRFRPDGAVLVSTPQDLALIDAIRAGQMFELGDIPVIGLVENMAGYACPHCGEVSDPFGSGGFEQAAGRLDLPFLGRVPLSLSLREASDAGRPPAAERSDTAFDAIADGLAQWMAANP